MRNSKNSHNLGYMNNNDRLAFYLKKLADARRQIGQSEFNFYSVCIDLDVDGCWRVTGATDFEQFLRGQAIDARVYREFRAAIVLLGADRMKKIGIHAARRIASHAMIITGGDEEKAKPIAEKIYEKADGEITAFLAKNQYLPSGGHSRKIIDDVTDSLGISRPKKDRPAKQDEHYENLVAALLQCLE
jgi:hypothetical protein